MGQIRALCWTLFVGLSACATDRPLGCVPAAVDAAADMVVAFGCMKNADCPSNQFCVPTYSCWVNDMDPRSDHFAPECMSTLQGQPCTVQGDHVECCR